LADNSSAKCGTSSYEMTRGLSCSIRAARFDSAAASSFVASFAVLEFEPHATMPPSNNDTAAAISPRSDQDCAQQHPRQKETPTGYGDPGDQDELAAALNLGSKLFDVLLKAHDLPVGIHIA
jgi:hypothetical protein